MTTIFNDPAEFTEESLQGFVRLHGAGLRAVPGGVVRRGRAAEPRVAVILGGGSGHYPAFAGLVGPGFGAGAVVGNLFTSPSTAQAYSVGHAADQGAGVIFTYGNYAGDVMNFGLAGERLGEDGVAARQVIVTDDIASAPPSRSSERRGIAGDFIVFKIMGAAAERGMALDEVVAFGERANAVTYSLGVAFSGCTFPGAKEPHFTVPAGKMGLGLGIHGEPGLEDIDWMPARELARLLVERVLEERPAGASGRVAVLLNGLGSTKQEELFLLWGHVAELLEDRGLELVAPEVGELVTSLDMGGVSLTVAWLDEELESLWLDPALTPAWQRGHVVAQALGDDDVLEEVVGVDEFPEASADSQAVAGVIASALTAAANVVRECEHDLGRVDAVAADGDHGRGMVKGTRAAEAAARTASARGAGARTLLEHAADAWAAEAGGTSGVLWGAGLRAFARCLDDTHRPDANAVSRGAQAFVAAVQQLGGAAEGDKTFVDAALPFARGLADRLAAASSLALAWEGAVHAAIEAAEGTASLEPKKGRARPLRERSLGHPDPGALSFGLVVEAVGAEIFGTEAGAGIASARRASEGLEGTE